VSYALKKNKKLKKKEKKKEKKRKRRATTLAGLAHGVATPRVKEQQKK